MGNSQSFAGIPGSYRRNMVFKSILVFIAGIILSSISLYLAIRQPIGPTYGEGFRMLAQLQQDIFSKSAVIYAITVLVILFGIIFLTLIYSHRIAGPVYRLSCFAKSLSDGDFSSNVHIRQNDAIHSLAGEMNNMVENYRDTLKIMQGEIKDLERYAEQLEKDKDYDQGWNGVGESAGKIAAELEKYKL